jgi:hypothetical protein
MAGLALPSTAPNMAALSAITRNIHQFTQFIGKRFQH